MPEREGTPGSLLEPEVIGSQPGIVDLQNDPRVVDGAGQNLREAESCDLGMLPLRLPSPEPKAGTLTHSLLYSSQ